MKGNPMSPHFTTLMRSLPAIFLAAAISAFAGELSTSVDSVSVDDDGTLVVQKTSASVPLGEAGNTVFMVPEMPEPGKQEIRVQVVNTPAPPEPRAYTATLIVQNHVQNSAYRDNLLGLADYLAADLADLGFQCVIPENVIGTRQNKTSSGEDVSGSSAVGQSQALGTDCLITVSIRSVALNRAGTEQMPTYAPSLRMTLNVVNNLTGATVAGQNVSVQLPAAWGTGDGVDWYQPLLESAASSCAAAVADKVIGRAVATDARLATVTFTCDVAGADVRIDGFAYGTTPIAVKIPVGVHEVEVQYPFCVPYKARANVQDGQRYNVSLQLTDLGRARYKDMTLFAEIVDRIRKTGATDDYVRRVLADGRADFLKDSHFHWDGAVQTLTIERSGVDPVIFGPVTTVVK